MMAFLVEIAFLFAKGMYVIFVFAYGDNLAGMSPYETTLFIGSYTFITGIMDSVYYPNIAAIPEYIRKGDLDFYIIKPVSNQFIVSFRKFDLGLGVPNCLAGIAMIAIAWYKLGIDVNFLNIFGFIYFTFMGSVLTYPILLIPVTFSFFIIKTEALQSLIWSLWDFNNMPGKIYSRGIRLIGTFIIPIFAITNFAPEFILGELSPL